MSNYADTEALHDYLAYGRHEARDAFDYPDAAYDVWDYEAAEEEWDDHTPEWREAEIDPEDRRYVSESDIMPIH